MQNRDPSLLLCAQMLGKDLSLYEGDELAAAFNGVGPFSEPTARPQAARLRLHPLAGAVVMGLLPNAPFLALFMSWPGAAR